MVRRIKTLQQFLGYFSVFAFIIFLSNCNSTTTKETTDNNLPIVLEEDSLAFYIQKQLNTSIASKGLPTVLFQDTLKQFYHEKTFAPLWIYVLNDNKSSWDTLENIFLHAMKHGMDTQFYFLPLIRKYKEQIFATSNSKLAYQAAAKCEILISSALLNMYENIANGRTNPKDIFGNNYLLPLNNLKALDYKSFLYASDKTKKIDALHQNDTTYQHLILLLLQEQKKVNQSTASLIEFTYQTKIQQGDTSPDIIKIIQRLKQQNLPDKSIQNINESDIYTKDLEKQIKKLQEKHRLSPDGVIGYKTIQIINGNPTDNLNQIIANLERQRWFNKPQTRPFVYVNLPEYMVNLHWKDSTSSFKICIGKNLPDNYDEMVNENKNSEKSIAIPKNMETPQIASRINYLVINPTWTIPYSIIRNEMWWKLVKDPAHLSRTGHKVYRGDSLINGDTINWKRINKMQIPYQIVQDPGPKNALGTVKFMFSNPFSIYLHDTPNKSAFNLTQRAVSHGCVRLEKPILFGEFLMQNVNKYDADDFRIMMGLLPKDEERLKTYDPTDTTAIIQPLKETTWVHLNQNMPLYFDYRTIYFDKAWNAHQCYDIYDENKRIIAAMRKQKL